MKMLVRRIAIFLIGLSVFLSLNALATITPALVSSGIGLAPMLQKVLPAVVNIRADIKITDIATLYRIQKERGAQLNPGETPDTFLSVGSGVIVDAAKGYILTNAHVVNDATTVIVTLGDGRHYSAKTIGLDKASDVALIQIKAKNLSQIPISNSNLLKVGDVVAAIGNPFGLSQTVTSGIVSALGRTSLGIENIENFIQTDAPINPGNSGGALINTQGELVGLNTAILAPDRGSIGIGFAVPSNIAKSIMDQLIKFGDVRRGVLGIGAQDITPDLASAFAITASTGAAVTLVKNNSPAQKAGLTPGDVITAVDGSPIKNANDVVSTVGFLRVNSKINIDFLRNNKKTTVSVTLLDPKELKTESETKDPFLNGVGMQNFALLSPIHGTVTGAAIVSVEPDSHAWQADLRPGDVVVSANGEQVTNIPDLQRVAGNAKDTLLLNVLRGPGAVFLVINKQGY